MRWLLFGKIILFYLFVELHVFGEEVVDTSARYLTLHKVGDGGCPYTASFLVDARLYVKIKWGLKWQKMESANWHAMSSCKKRFQFRSPKVYFVNHMSAFEHGTRKKLGYNVSEKNTLIFSNAAKAGECEAIGSDYNQNTLGILPFYGGRPPGVKADSSGTLKVTSIGQGNSLIKAEIKALQTMAVLCSILKYFAYVIVGVANTNDEALIKAEVSKLGTSIATRVHVQLMINLHKPANLPFHLLEYAKFYIKKTNECLDQIPKDALDNVPNKCHDYFTEFIDEQKQSIGPTPVGWRIKYLYYTESDQIVKFKDFHIRDAVISATNITTMLIGRRLEKEWKSTPKDYMSNLTATRAVCGVGLYALDWPATHYVHKINKTDYEKRLNTILKVPIPGIDEPEPVIYSKKYSGF